MRLSDIQVAMHGEQMIGIAACYNNDIESGNAFVSYLGVALKYRRLGFGRGLLRASIRQSICRRMLRIGLETWSGNVAGLALYRSEGFLDQCVKTVCGVQNVILMKHLVSSGIDPERHFPPPPRWIEDTDTAFAVKDRVGQELPDFFVECGPIAPFSGQTTADHGPLPAERAGEQHVEREQNAREMVRAAARADASWGTKDARRQRWRHD